MSGCVNNNPGGMQTAGLGGVGGHAGHGSSNYSTAALDFQNMLQPGPGAYPQPGYGAGSYPPAYGQPPVYQYAPSYPPYNYTQGYGAPMYQQPYYAPQAYAQQAYAPQAYGVQQPYGYSPYANGASRLGNAAQSGGTSALLSQAFAAGRIQADGPYTSQALQMANALIESDPNLKQAFYAALARGDTFNITSRDSGGPSFATIFPDTPDGQRRTHQLNFNIQDYQRAPNGALEVVAHELWHTLGNVDHGDTHDQLIANTLSAYSQNYARAGFR